MILLVTMALAGERPALVDDPACPMRSLKAGTAVLCDSVTMSLAKARFYAETVEWADGEHDRRTLDLAICEADIDALKGREAWWKLQAEKPPAPKLSPLAVFGLGAGTGAIAVLVGALSVRAVVEAPLYE